MKNLLFVFVLILTLASCRKDPEIIEVKINSKIQFGNYENMDTITYNIGLIGGISSSEYLYMDVNKDGRKDVQVIAGVSGSNGGGYAYFSNMKCLHNDFKILGFLSDNFTYYYTDTTYWASNTEIGFTNQDIHETYSCAKINEFDAVINLEPDVFNVLQYKEGDTLDMLKEFKSDTISLISDSFSATPISYSNGVDTTFSIYRSYRRNCNSFPGGEYRYVGFKVKDANNEYKYGWIKLAIGFNDNLVYIVETAMMKP